MEAITEEINSLNLQGESKEAIIKVRVNQGVFRNKLLKRFSYCCLCGVNTDDLEHSARSFRASFPLI